VTGPRLCPRTVAVHRPHPAYDRFRVEAAQPLFPRRGRVAELQLPRAGRRGQLAAPGLDRVEQRGERLRERGDALRLQLADQRLDRDAELGQGLEQAARAL